MNSERFYQLDAHVEEFSYGIETSDRYETIIDKLKGEIDYYENMFNERISLFKDDSDHFYKEFNATVGLNNAFGEFSNSTVAFMEQVELYQQNYQNISNILDSVDEFKETSRCVFKSTPQLLSPSTGLSCADAIPITNSIIYNIINILLVLFICFSSFFYISLRKHSH
ncbi:MAG: hypothetical protein UR20_C0033G0012 [Candidatus Woesebacteria bacterium GW2011_GWE2_31_6]|nr:MAG: hypothetical protein UR20_C0033G0012 [Candidatus Woesebacteria bacterium GW2011_GWE2_31_6]